MAKTIEEKMDTLLECSRYDEKAHCLAADILAQILIEDVEARGKIFAALPLLPREAGALIDHLAVLGGTLERSGLLEDVGDPASPFQPRARQKAPA